MTNAYVSRPYVPALVSCGLVLVAFSLAGGVTPIYDAILYSGVASGLLGLTDPVIPPADLEWAIEAGATRGFIYPLFVAAVYAIKGGADYASAELLQGLLFLPLTTLLVYLAGREAFSRRAGLIGAWLFALWFPAAWQSRFLLTETMLAFLMALLLACLAGLVVRKSPRLALLTGLTAAVVSIAHPGYQLVWLVLGIAVLAHFGRRLASFYALGAVVFIVYRLFLFSADLPYPGQGQIGREQIGYGSGGGWTFYVSSRWETGFRPTPDDRRISAMWHRPFGELVAKVDSGEVVAEDDLLATIRRKAGEPGARLTDADFYRAGFANLLEHPDRWPERTKVNAASLFLLPANLELAPGDPRSPVLRRVWRPLSGIVALLSAAGLVLIGLRRRDRLILFIPALFQATLFLTTTISETRYAVPLWPAMFLLVGVALGELSDAYERRHKRSTTTLPTAGHVR